MEKIEVEIEVTRRYTLFINATSESEAEHLARNMSIEDIERDRVQDLANPSNSSMTVLDATRVKD